MVGRAVARIWLSVSLAVLIAASVGSIGAFASLDLTVRDNNQGDDVAHVILFYPGGGDEDLGYTPQGSTIGRTWDLLTESDILSRGAGLYTLRIIHDADTNAVCANPGDEVLGTFDITFGGGIVVSAVEDEGSATNGASTTIDVLANDLLVDASSFSFGQLDCPLTTPDPSCACSTYGGGQCPSVLTFGLNYVEGTFTVTVDDPTLAVLLVSDPPHGTATIVGRDVRYTPDPGFCGTDTFTYTVQRGGAQDTGTIEVDVTASPPTTQDDAVSTLEETPVTIDVLANDGSGLTLVSVAPPAHGTAVLTAGEVRYTPQARFEGTDRFTYTAENACGAVSTAEVRVDVEHRNQPPKAHAGGFYQGIVGEPIELDAKFSRDPDLTDRLEYRWDLDDDGRYDTEWSRDERYVAVYERPYVGRVVVEVRDVYRGEPTGATDTDSAFARIDPVQTLQALVFEDLDGDNVWSSDEPGLPGADVSVAEETLTTGADGRVSIELDSGTWTVAMAPSSIAALEARGFAVVVSELEVALRAGENAVAALAVVKVSTRLTGVVYRDINENGEFDKEDRVAEGLLVVLDGDDENPTRTDERGRFAFRDVPFGDHTILIQEADAEEGSDPLNLLVPFTLARTEKAEVAIAWPYDLGPEEGFLQVDVEKGERRGP